jgi:hypothetical protein
MGMFVHVSSRRWKGFVVKILVRRIKDLLWHKENSTEKLMATFV